jgi:hypothetical protein
MFETKGGRIIFCYSYREEEFNHDNFSTHYK